MITLHNYFGNKKYPIEHLANANKLLAQVNLCLYYAERDGCYEDRIDPDTNSQISGVHGGAGDGGYRTPDSRTGAVGSCHRIGQGLDVYDPERKLAQWCVKNKSKLSELGLYCEDFRYTPTWAHYQTRRPVSGKTIFIPYSDYKNHPPTAPALEGQSPLPFVVKT